MLESIIIQLCISNLNQFDEKKKRSRKSEKFGQFDFGQSDPHSILHMPLPKIVQKIVVHFFNCCSRTL